MKTYIDNKLFSYIHSKDIEKEIKSISEVCLKSDILIEKKDFRLIEQWTNLLMYLDLGSLFNDFFAFDEQNDLFNCFLSVLNANTDKDLLIRLYDQLFVECLTHVKNLPEIDPAFLIDLIAKKKTGLSHPQAKELILPLLDHYEKYIQDHPPSAMHDLILYLAWDRVCVNLAKIFEYNTAEPGIRPGLDVLKGCILESFHHITEQKRTTPGYFRLIEALYADEMREENLQNHPEEGWEILCKGVQALKQRENMIDVFYIDGALINCLQQETDVSPDKKFRLLTIEPLFNVEAGLSLAAYLNNKIKQDIPKWPYALEWVEVICLKPMDDGYSVEGIIVR